MILAAEVKKRGTRFEGAKLTVSVMGGRGHVAGQLKVVGAPPGGSRNRSL